MGIIVWADVLRTHVSEARHGAPGVVVGVQILLIIQIWMWIWGVGGLMLVGRLDL